MIPIQKKYIYTGVGILVTGLVLCGWFAVKGTAVAPQVSEWHLTLSVGDTPVSVEIANTDDKRRRGLSGREFLPDGMGMLFIHSEEGLYSYWMPDMRISLDILWINTEMRVVHIEEMVMPESYPASFTSEAPARYVLEVPGGFVAKHNIQAGDTVTLR